MKKIDEIQKGQSALAKAVGAERKGALVYWWLSGVMVSTAKVKDLYQKHDLDWDKWGPPEQRASVAFRKTLKEVGRDINKKGDDRGYLIRLIDEGDDHIIYGVVREDRLKAQEDLAHQCEAKIKLKKKSERVVISQENPTGGYKIAKKVKELFSTMFSHMVVQDFSRLLTRNIGMMAAVSIRPTGAIYFVPETERQDLAKMRAVLEDVPGTSHLCMIDIWGEQTDLARDTKVALEQELKELKLEIEAFREKAPREQTLKDRLVQFRKLKERGKLFADLLDFNMQELNKGLTQCGKAVESMIAGNHFKGADTKKKAKKETAKKVRKVEVEETKGKRVSTQQATKGRKKAAKKKKRRASK